MVGSIFETLGVRKPGIWVLYHVTAAFLQNRIHRYCLSSTYVDSDMLSMMAGSND